jgi:voltage-gated potassium channel
MSGDRPIMRRIERRPLTARRAGVAIAVTTALVTFAGAVLVWLVDRKDFDTLDEAAWWAVQTVTTVGYGDVTPTSGSGRAIAAIVMLAGIGFVTVVTAAITAAFIESARRQRGDSTEERLAEISARLDRIEQRLEER